MPIEDQLYTLLINILALESKVEDLTQKTESSEASIDLLLLMTNLNKQVIGSDKDAINALDKGEQLLHNITLNLLAVAFVGRF